MCDICNDRLMNRRKVLALAGFGLVAGSSLFGAGQAFAEKGAVTTVTADQALANLKAGNEKFVKAPEVCAADLVKSRTAVANHRRRGQPS
jgi:carbonic anhydrase